MTKKEFKEIEKKWKTLTDEERWYFLRDAPSLGLIVQLDNDNTFVIHPDIEDEYLSFDEFVGWSEGVQTLLSVIDIKAEPV